MRYLCLLAGEPEVAGPEARLCGVPADAGRLPDGDGGHGQQWRPRRQRAAPAAFGRRSLRLRNGKPLVTDGPFMEIKEVIGGYYVLECADMDEALRWAATIPAARYGVIEVRPIMTITAG